MDVQEIISSEINDYLQNSITDNLLKSINEENESPSVVREG
jgi:hypothetical protein